MSKKLIGGHLHFSRNNYKKTANEIVLTGSKTASIFVKSPRSWSGKSFSEQFIQNFQNSLKNINFDIKNLTVHAGYLPNLCNKNPKNFNSLLNECKLTHQLGIRRIVVHCGSSGKSSIECIKLITDRINNIHKKYPVQILLETPHSSGSPGSTPEQLLEIISGVKKKSKVGICLDTAHLWSSGYDINNPENVYKKFHKINKYVRWMHCNNAKYALGSGKDEHMPMKSGVIKFSNIKKFIKKYRNILGITLESCNSSQNKILCYKKEFKLF